jgi:hypothetical protein
MAEGEISNNKENMGGGVHNMGKFIMLDGKISNNIAFDDYHYVHRMGWRGSNGLGGGVYNIGVFVMYGGTISGNTAEEGKGGGVHNRGTFSMSGGVIMGNKANVDNEIYNSPDDTFDKNGGIVFNHIDSIILLICVSSMIGAIAFLFSVFKNRRTHREK